MRRSGLVYPLEVRLANGQSFMGVLPEAITTSVWRTGLHDWHATGLVESLLGAGETFVDVGAHFGYFSLIAGRCVGNTGRVCCIEAMPEAFGYLRRNTALIRGKVDLFNVAAWDTTTVLKFSDAGVINSRLASAFGPREPMLASGRSIQVDVPTRRLDDILDEASVAQVHGVKVDVESAELRVLQGAVAALERWKPWVVIELGDFELGGGVSDPPRSAKILDFMADRNFLPYAWADGCLTMIEISPPVRYMNVAFLHEKSRLVTCV